MGSDCLIRFFTSVFRAFQSTLPGWGATLRGRLLIMRAIFQSTLPGWGATASSPPTNQQSEFQSTLPGWGATVVTMSSGQRSIFQSTLPGWGATPVRQRARMHHFISIHAPRMGSDGRADGVAGLGLISIHAPRMGSDRNRPPASAGRGDFNPRSPDGERHQGRAMTASEGKFQSTLPGWGATVDAADRLLVAGISIHAPRMGSDLSDTTCHALRFLFQSTLPGWGATAKMDIFAHDMGKIIHFQH